MIHQLPWDSGSKRHDTGFAWLARHGKNYPGAIAMLMLAVASLLH